MNSLKGSFQPVNRILVLVCLSMISIKFYFWITDNLKSTNTLQPTHFRKNAISTFYNQTLDPPGIIFDFKGGIGNQLFQFACSYAMARDLNWPLYTFIYNNSRADRDFGILDRDFALDYFNLPVDNLIDNTTNVVDVAYVSDEELLDQIHLRKEYKFYALDGASYCQSPEYWIKYAKDIFEMLTIKPQLLNSTAIETFAKNIREAESVAVHIRRGDFLYMHPGYFVPIQFHKKAIRRIMKMLKTKDKDLVFYVFSDDANYAQRQLKDLEGDRNKFVFVSGMGLSSLEEFYLMWLCKHFVVPNSTFSWWAAYLKKSKEKIVIASAYNPAYWSLFNETDERKEFYMMLYGTLYHPKEWIVIDPFTGES